MIQNKLKALLLSAGLITMSFTIKAHDWFPVGDCVQEVNGVKYAYGFSEGEICDCYEDGDRIFKPSDCTGSCLYTGACGTLLRKPIDAKITKQTEKKDKTAKDGRLPFSPFGTINEPVTSSVDPVLNIYGLLNKNGEECPLKVDGDVRLTADTVDMTINIKTPVTIMPYVDPTAVDSFGQDGTNTGQGFSQLYFDAQSGRTITVNVDFNLEFVGRTLGLSSVTQLLRTKAKSVVKSSDGSNIVTRGGEGEDTCTQLEPLDMIITFKGTGKTVFKLADGTTIKFTGDIDGCHPVDVCDNNSFNGVSNNAGGTKVFITMDQTQADVNCFKDKLVFERAVINNSDTDRVGVVVGPNSIITYVSTDATGIAHESNSSLGNFASMAFDPSNNGTGRMVLFILGAYTFGFDSNTFTSNDPGYLGIDQKYPFNEGSLIIQGHHVDGFEPDQIRTTLNYSIPAGGQATMRVTDDKFYAARPVGAYSPTERRGLLVINDVQSVTKRASDPYEDFFNAPTFFSRKMEKDVTTKGAKKVETKRTTKDACCNFTDTSFNCFNVAETQPAETFGYDWSYSRFVCDCSNTRNVRNGFIVGINGVLDINHNTFMDYVAGSVNQTDLLALNDYQTNKVAANKLLKDKNPAAMIIDGLDSTLFTESFSDFVAADPFNRTRPIHARINLRGDGTLLLRAAGSTDVGYITNLWSSLVPNVMRKPVVAKSAKSARSKKSANPLRGGEGDTVNPVDDPSFDFDEGLLVSTSIFDGYRLVQNDDHVNPLGVAQKCCDESWAVSVSGEGQHVIEFEGKGTVWSFSNTSILDPANDCASRSYASEVSSAGRVNMPTIAIDYTGTEIDSRPLTIGNSFDRYNSPAMFFNDNAHFVNTNIIHNDVTKLIDGNPADSEPAVVGGERLYFAHRKFEFDGETSPMIVDHDRFRFPEIQLYNSVLHLQDSLNATGVRWVVKDRPILLADGKFTEPDGDTPDVSGQDGNNTSVVKFYDHGDTNDTNFTGNGRIFQLGSLHSTTSDGHTTNWATEGTYWNVFKHNALTDLTCEGDLGTAASTNVTLSLQNGDQFPLVLGLRATDEFIDQRAHHLFLHSVMGQGATNMAIGWSELKGDSSDAFPYRNTMYPKDYDAKEVFSTDQCNRFDLDALVTTPATVSMDGHFICWGGFDCDGKSVNTPINRDNNQGVVYVNHGGMLTITQPEDLVAMRNTTCNTLGSGVPYETIIDTVIAQQVANDYNNAGDQRVRQLTGIVNLPHDQSTFVQNAGIQPYGFTKTILDERADETTGYMRLSFDNGCDSTTLSTCANACRTLKSDRSGAEEAIINWFNREGDNLVFEQLPTRSLAANHFKKSGKAQTRLTESVTVPVLKPARLLYIGTNDDIDQLKVAGATQSDPLVIEVSGDSVSPVPGRVRELVTLPRTQDLAGNHHMVGEGDHAHIYLEYAGRIGIGNRGFNGHSKDAWTRLGKDHIQILPLGDGVVDVNSNLLVSDKQAIVATTQFSQTFDGVPSESRLTFYAETPKEIRIPAGMELDLSSFGQAPSVQQIALGGKVRMIFEAGSILRFPSADNALARDENGDLIMEGEDTVPGGPVVLYVNDEAELIFEGQIEPQEFTQAFIDSDAAQLERVKIVGKGQIWTNKNGKILVNGPVSVGVQSDAQTPSTDIVISLNRESEFNIGTEVLSGGAFEVGNPTDLGEAEVNFSLVHFGGNPRTHINRQGFFGLGAGVVDKHGTMNGDASRTNNPVIVGGVASIVGGFPVFNPETDPNLGWTVQALFNVNNITIDLTSGRFEHNRIARGDDSVASLMAFGPALTWDFKLNGPKNAQVVAGGNIMKVPAGMSNKKVNLWDFAGVQADGEQYSIMASAPSILDRSDIAVTPYLIGGRSFSFTTLDTFFALMAPRPTNSQPAKKAMAGLGNFINSLDFINVSVNPGDIYPAATNKIVRVNDPVLAAGRFEDALITGAVTARSDGPIDPTVFSTIGV